MEGNPADFETIGNRIGFQIDQSDGHCLKLSWKGPKFPALLCLGIALALLFISVPIIQAVRVRGFVGPAAALWYFPLMNLILLGISLYLLSLRRTILVDASGQRVVLTRGSLFRDKTLTIASSDVTKIHLGMDQVYSGFAMAGSSAAQTFPVPSLRLIPANGPSVLLDRGSRKRLARIGELISQRLQKPLESDLEPPG